MSGIGGDGEREFSGLLYGRGDEGDGVASLAGAFLEAAFAMADGVMHLRDGSVALVI